MARLISFSFTPEAVSYTHLYVMLSEGQRNDINYAIPLLEQVDIKESVTEDVFETPWLRRLLELKDIEELDRDIIVEMIDQITAVSYTHLIKKM